MPEREPISKALRFEVFKRDSFTCQYCGAKAPESVLHCDHIKPVKSGGKAELLNLVTACATCNLGKGARKLDDMSAVERQRRQLEELNERRQQLEMMLEWRDDLAKHQVDQVQVVCDAIGARSNFSPNDSGKIKVRRWVKRFGLAETLAAMDEAFDRYLDDPTNVGQWQFAFKKIGVVADLRAQEKADPHIRKLLYIQGILRNRWKIDDLHCVDALRQRVVAGYGLAALEAAAKGARMEDGWKELDERAIAMMKQAAPVGREETPEHDQPEDAETYESWAAWDDPRWHIEMWSRCFGDSSAARILNGLATWCRFGGYVDGESGKITREDARVIFGMYATGLVNPISEYRGVCQTDERGNITPCFRIHCLSPREATNAFNRFGALRLSFWDNARAFAPVSAVH